MPKSTSNISFHNISVNQSLNILETTEKGLTDIQIKKRLEKHGLNKIPDKEKYNPFISLLNQFKSPLIYILIFAGIISIYFNHLVDVYVITTVILVNTMIGFIQEYKAEKSINALKSLVVQNAKIIRNGELIQINAEQLVPGDILVLEEGDKIPADARLIESKNLQTIEASLTGESMPAQKTLGIYKTQTSLADRKNMVYMSTFVSKGYAKAVVTGTGKKTALGKIALDITKIKKVKSHFEIKTQTLANMVGIVSVTGAIIIFLIGFFIRKFELIDIFLFTVAALVSAIPEGLPAILAIVLAIGASRLSKKNAIIRNLASTETLGVVNVIATDKTGTLTKNIITVQDIYIPGKDNIQITGTGWETKGNFTIKNKSILPLEDEQLQKLMHIATLCNKTKIIKKEGSAEKYEILGDPTEASLVVLAEKAGISKNALVQKEIVIDDLPFNSENRYRASLIDIKEKKEKQIYVIGAPETILGKSKYVLNKKITKKHKDEINRNIERLSSKAMRVLAIAYKKANKDEKEIDKKDIDGLYFVGLVGMIDPPREEAEEAIKKAHMAGIRVIMTTGDHKQTAIAIAKRIGITRKDKPEFPIAYSQEELKKLSKNEFSKVITNVNVFARLTPSMKLKITTLLQSKGNIVAMTGDGVNDAPALRKADIGIAMGITGTDVARESAEIVLRNDNFASIVSAVEEGRTIFTNIRQAVSFLVTTNLSEFLLIFLALFLGLPLPLLPTQVLWLNLVTDGVPDISLATEKGSDAVLKHRPRDKNENIISRKILPFLTINTLVMTVITFGVFTYFLDTSIDRARTAAFATMSFTQLFNVYNMRSLEKSLFEIGIFSNKYVNMAFLFSAVLSVIAIFNPFFKHVLKFNGLTYLEFICIVLVSLLVIVIGELYKYTKNKIYKPRTSVVYHSSEA